MNLEIRNLAMSYGKRQALSGVTLTIRSGGLTGLVGPNGAGKSTLLKILATLLRPTRGEIFLDGADIRKKPDVLRSVLGICRRTFRSTETWTHGSSSPSWLRSKN